MKALLKFAREDDAAEAAAEKTAEMLRQNSQAPEVKMTDASDCVINMVEATTNDEEHRNKLMRAIERTDLTATDAQWYFFVPGDSPVRAPASRFPKRAASGIWSFLVDDETRPDYFHQGIVWLALKGEAAHKPSLPDELFLWLLNEVCREPLDSLRAQYIKVLAQSSEQIHRLVDPGHICLLFEKLHANPESVDLSATLETAPAVNDPYPDRNWCWLQSVLVLLDAIAEKMNGSSLSYALKILLRLGIDPAVDETMDVLLLYRNAIRKLTSAVPRDHWNDLVNLLHRIYMYIWLTPPRVL